jgi:hypothetical protein
LIIYILRSVKQTWKAATGSRFQKNGLFVSITINTHEGKYARNPTIEIVIYWAG